MEVLSSIVPMLLIFGVFWFVLIRPQVKERETQEAMIAGLAKDDRVVTWGGLHGRVAAVAESTVTVEVAKGVTVTLEKASVLRKVTGEPANKAG